MTRSVHNLGCWVALVMLALGITNARAAYPERPITLIVPWGVGGGTDATARLLARHLTAQLNVPVDVVNRTGDEGVRGLRALAQAPADGYTLGIVTLGGQIALRAASIELDHESFTPLTLYNEDPASLLVRADAPYRSAVDLLAAARSDRFRASGGARGDIWHLAWSGALGTTDVAPASVVWQPDDAAVALRELAAGRVDVVICSLPEAAAALAARQIRSLAVMNPARLPAFPEIPTLQEATGATWSFAAWRGIVGPRGLDEEVRDILVAALQQIQATPDFAAIMAQWGFSSVSKGPAAFAARMAASDAAIRPLIEALGAQP